MKWLDTLKRIFTRKDLARRLQQDPTEGRRPRRPFVHAEAWLHDLPIFRIREAELMRQDPVVQFGLTVRNAALSAAQVNVTGENPEVVKFVGKQWKKLWNEHGPQLWSAKRYGFAAFQVLYAKQKSGTTRRLEIDGLKSFAPYDVRALTNAGTVAGFTLKPRFRTTGGLSAEKILAPQGLWITFNSEWGNAYGRAILRRSYPSWFEKWMDHGVKKVTQLRMLKDSYVGSVGWYPMESVPDQDGNIHPWRDIIREMQENLLTGGNMQLPSNAYPDGAKKFDWTPATDTGDPVGIWNWADRIDKEIWHGLDVFEEVIQASETGSGYSGRSVPLMMFLQSKNL